MAEAKFRIGDAVFVRKPHFYKPLSTSIVGVVEQHELRGAVHFYGFKDNGFPGGDLVWIPECDLGHRPGTPFSQLSGRPSHDGHGEFVRISETWEFP